MILHCSSVEKIIILCKFSGRDAAEIGGDFAMSGEGSDELQDIHRIKEIEKQVASLAMEKALISVLKYYEGKQISCNPPLSGKVLNAYKYPHLNIHFILFYF